MSCEVNAVSSNYSTKTERSRQPEPAKEVRRTSPSKESSSAGKGRTEHAAPVDKIIMENEEAAEDRGNSETFGPMLSEISKLSREGGKPEENIVLQQEKTAAGNVPENGSDLFEDAGESAGGVDAAGKAPEGESAEKSSNASETGGSVPVKTKPYSPENYTVYQENAEITYYHKGDEPFQIGEMQQGKGRNYLLSDESGERRITDAGNGVLVQKVGENYVYTELAENQRIYPESFRPEQMPENIRELAGLYGEPDFYPHPAGGFYSFEMQDENGNIRFEDYFSNGNFYGAAYENYELATGYENVRAEFIAESQNFMSDQNSRLSEQDVPFQGEVSPEHKQAFQDAQRIAGTRRTHCIEQVTVSEALHEKIGSYTEALGKTPQEYIAMMVNMKPEDALLNIRKHIDDPAVTGELCRALGYSHTPEELLNVCNVTGRDFMELSGISAREDGDKQIQALMENFSPEQRPVIPFDDARLNALESKAMNAYHDNEVEIGQRNEFLHGLDRGWQNIKEGFFDTIYDIRGAGTQFTARNAANHAVTLGHYREQAEREARGEDIPWEEQLMARHPLEYMNDYEALFSQEDRNAMLKLVEDDKIPQAWGLLEDFFLRYCDQATLDAARARQDGQNIQDRYYSEGTNSLLANAVEAGVDLGVAAATYLICSKAKAAQVIWTCAETGASFFGALNEQLQDPDKSMGEAFLVAAGRAGIELGADTLKGKGIDTLFIEDSVTKFLLDYQSGMALDAALESVMSGWE